MANNSNIFALLLAGLDADASAEQINQQLNSPAFKKKLAELKISMDMDPKMLDGLEKAMKNVHSTAQDISKELRQASKAFDNLQAQRMRAATTKATQAPLMAKARETLPPGTDFSIMSQQADAATGAVNRIRLEYEDLNKTIHRVNVTMTETGDIEVSDVKMIGTLNKSYKEFEKTINSTEKALKGLYKQEAAGEGNAELTAKITAELEKQAEAERVLTQEIEAKRQSANMTNEEFQKFGTMIGQTMQDSKKNVKDFQATLADKSSFKEATQSFNEWKKVFVEITELQNKQVAQGGELGAGDQAKLNLLQEELKALEDQTSQFDALIAKQVEFIESQAPREQVNLIQQEIAVTEERIKQLDRLQNEHLKLQKIIDDASLRAGEDPEAENAKKRQAQIDDEIAKQKELLRTSNTTREGQKAAAESLNASEAKFAADQETRMARLEKADQARLASITKQMGEVKEATHDLDLSEPLDKNSESLQKFIVGLDGSKASIISTSIEVDKFGNEYQRVVSVVDEAADVQEIHTRNLRTNTNEVRENNVQTKTQVARLTGLTEQLGHAAKKMAVWAVATKLLYGSLRTLKQGFEFIKDLDKDITQAAIVTGQHREQVAYLGDEYAALGVKMGKTVQEISGVNTALLRQGLTMDEAAKRMDTIVKLSSTGQIATEESLQIITAAVNAMQESHTKTADVLLKASNISASSVEELGKAFTKTASSAYATGMSIEQTTGILATMLEVTREGPDQLGTSLKTILARFTRVNQETGEFNTELNKVQGAVESVGVSFVTADGQIRNVYDILEDLSGVWQDLDKNQQAYVATTSAGVRMQNRFFAVMNNFDRVREITERTGDAAGTMNKAYITYLDSVEASNNRMKASLQELYIQMINPEAIKFFQDMATSILGLVKAIGGYNVAAGGLITLILFKAKTLPAIAAHFTQLAVQVGFAGSAATAAAPGFIALGAGVAATVGVIAVAAVALVGIAKAFQNAKAEAEATRKALVDLNNQHLDNVQNSEYDRIALEELGNEYEELSKKVQDSGLTADRALDTEEYQRYLNLQEEMLAIYPDLITETDRYGNQTIILTDGVKGLLAQYDEFVDITAEEFKAKHEEIIETVVGDLKDYDKAMRDIARAEANLASGKDLHGIEIWTEEQRLKAEEQYEELLKAGEEATREYAQLIEQSIEIYIAANADTLTQYEQDMLRTHANIEHIMDQGFKGEGLTEYFKKIADGTTKYDGLTKSLKDNQKEAAILNEQYLEGRITYAEYEAGIEKVTQRVDELTGSEFELYKAQLSRKVGMGYATPEELMQLEILNQLINDTAIAVLEEKDAFEALQEQQVFWLENMEESQESIDVLNELLEANKDGYYSTIEGQIKLGEIYPELIGLVGDEVAIREALEEKLDEEVAIRWDNQYKILMNSKTFYNQALADDTDFRNFLSDNYDGDLTNFTSIAQAKLAVEAEIVARLSGIWAQYYGDVKEGNIETIRELRNIINDPNARDVDKKGAQSVFDTIATLEGFNKELEKVTANFKQTQLDAQKVADTVGGPVTSAIKGANKAAEEHVDLIKQMQAEYKLYLSLMDAATRAIKLQSKENDEAQQKLKDQIADVDTSTIAGLVEKHRLTELLIAEERKGIEIKREQQQQIHEQANALRALAGVTAEESNAWFDANNEMTAAYILALEAADEEQAVILQNAFDGLRRLKALWDSLGGDVKVLEVQIKTNVQELTNISAEAVKRVESARSAWVSAGEAVAGLNEQIANIGPQMEALEKTLAEAKFTHWIDSLLLGLARLDSATELLEFKLSLYDEFDYDNRIRITGELYEESQRKLAGYRAEMETLQNVTPKSAAEASQLASAMEQVKQGTREAFLAVREYNKEINALNFQAISHDFNSAMEQLNMQIKLIDHNLASIKEGFLPDLTLDMIMPMPDFSEIFDLADTENDDFYKEQKDLEDKILAMKQKSHDLQLAEAQAFYDKQMAALQKQLDDLRDKLEEAEIAEAKAKEEYEEAKRQAALIAAELLQAIIDEENDKKAEKERETDAEIEGDKEEHHEELERGTKEDWIAPVEEAIEDHTIKVEGDIQGHLSSLEGSFTTSWGNIVETVSKAVGTIAGLVEEALALVDTVHAAVASAGEAVDDAGDLLDQVSDPSGTFELSGPPPADKAMVTPWADGTKGTPKDEVALVGEEGRELGILPSGSMVMFGQYGSELVHLPKGTEILSNPDTEQWLKDRPAYKKGTDRDEERYDFIDGYLVPSPTINELLARAEENMQRPNAEDWWNNSDVGKYWDSNLVHRHGISQAEVNALKDKHGIPITTTKEPERTVKKPRETEPESSSSRSSSSYSSHSVPGAGSTTYPETGPGTYPETEIDSRDYLMERPDMNITMSEDFIEGAGKYLEGVYSLLGFGGYAKYIDEREENIDEITKMQEDYLNNVDSILKKDDILAKIDEQLVKDAQANSFLKQDILEQGLENTKEYIAALKSQYEVAKDSGDAEGMRNLYQEINAMLEEQIKLEHEINEAIKERNEILFAIADRESARLDKQMADLEYAKTMHGILKPDDIAGMNDLHDKTLGILNKQTKQWYEQLQVLHKQAAALKVGTREWEQISNRISDVIGNIRQANIEIAQMAMSMFTTSLSSWKDKVTGSGSGGGGGGGSSSSKSDEDKYLEGLERELELRKLMIYVEKEGLTVSASQLEILYSQEKLKKSSLDLIRKELELQALLMKMENVRGEKNIQQLTKKADGSFDWTYVADQTELANLEEQIIDKRLEIIRAEQSIAKEDQPGAGGGGGGGGSDDGGFAAELDQAINNMENRVYKSKQALIDALLAIGVSMEDAMEIADEYWKMFVATAAPAILSNLDLMGQILETQIKGFEEVGNKAGEAYANAILNKVAEIMDGPGDIIEKHQAIFDYLASEYTQFALAGNEAGMNWVMSLIRGMETEDSMIPTDLIPEKMIAKLQAYADELRTAGDETGALLIEGVIAGIVDSVEDNEGTMEEVAAEVMGLLGKFEDYGNLGDVLGKSFMDHLRGKVEEGKEDVDITLTDLIDDLDARYEDFEEAGDAVGMAYTIALKDQLLEASENTELTADELIELLNQAEEFNYMGYLSGEAYALGIDELLTQLLEDTGLTAEQIQAVLSDVEGYEESGYLVGEAYSTALMEEWAELVEDMELTEEQKLDILNKMDEYQESGELVGDAYRRALAAEMADTFSDTEGGLDKLTSMLAVTKNFDLAAIKTGGAYGTKLEGELKVALEKAGASQADITTMLQKIKEFDLAGAQSGEAYSTQMQAKLVLLMKEAGILDDDIADVLMQADSFARAGTKSGAEYEKGLLAEMEASMTKAGVSKDVISAKLAEVQKFLDAGRKAGGEYGQGITDGLVDGASKIDNSAIVSALEKDAANFGIAGTTQGEAYSSAINRSFRNAMSYAKTHIDNFIQYLKDNPIVATVKVGTQTEGDPMPPPETFATGGYTGEWADDGKLAVLHEKELVLNKYDTDNMLKTIQFTRDMVDSLPKFDMSAIGRTPVAEGDQIFQISNVEFPNVENSQEIERAFRNLSGQASQWANRR